MNILKKIKSSFNRLSNDKINGAKSLSYQSSSFSLGCNTMFDSQKKNNPMESRCVDLLANGVSNDFPKLYRMENDNKVEIMDHEIVKILRNPNPFMCYRDLVKSIVMNLIYNGNSYLMINKINNSPSEIYILRSENVKVVFGKNGLPISYKYSNCSGAAQEEFVIDPINNESKIIHIHTDNPDNPYVGIPMINSIKNSISMSELITQWNKSIINNSARPSGALVVKENGSYVLSQEQRIALENGLNKGHNVGSTFMLSENLEWKELSTHAMDMDFKNLQEKSINDIAIGLGVPLEMISESSTYNNKEKAIEIFNDMSVMPIKEKILNKINILLSKYYGKDLFFSI